MISCLDLQLHTLIICGIPHKFHCKPELRVPVVNCLLHSLYLTMSRAILVCGATGKQGGALIRALISSPTFTPSAYTIYALTRSPNGTAAKKLASLSLAVKLVEGDFADIPGLFASLSPAPWGAFFVHAVGAGEAEHGKQFVDESIKAGVRHIVVTGVDRGGDDSDSDPTNVPHFKAKWEYETHLRERAEASGGKVSYTILRPVAFMDNFSPGFPGKVVGTCFRDSQPLSKKQQWVDTVDIGRWAAEAFLHPEDPKYHNKAISLAGDELSFEEINTIYRQKTGVDLPTTYWFVGWLVRYLVKDLGLMFQWFNNVGYKVNVEACRTAAPNGQMVTFGEWVDREVLKKTS